MEWEEINMQDDKLQSSEGKGDIPYREGQAVSPGSRLKFWEVDHLFKCPLVGTCLTLSEQRQLLKKFDPSGTLKTPFEMHEMLVACSDTENALSRRVDNLLNGKFGREAGKLLDLEYEAFLSEFKARIRTGDHDFLLWAAAIRPGLPKKLKREIFGEIHMAMHWNGEHCAELQRTLNRQEKELLHLRQCVEEGKRHRRSLQKENESLKREQAELKARSAAAERERSKVERSGEGNASPGKIGSERDIAVLKQDLEGMRRTLREKERDAALLREENLRLTSEIEKQEELNSRFLSESQEVIRELISLSRCHAQCPSFDLCKKRVLIVGGMTRMASLYRDLIEGSGGVFEYHDGYMQKGDGRLESLLKRADVVLCPVNCNSHTACTLVKNLAKKHNKTFICWPIPA
jgi:hypothetical protein